MALAGAPTSLSDRQPSPAGAPALTLNLSSNNPFRNRAVSPASASPRSANTPVTGAPPSRMSKNPFLDASEVRTNGNNNNNNKDSAGIAADIFDDLSLLDKPANGTSSSLPRSGPPPRVGTMPVNGSRPAGPGERREPPRPPRGADSPERREQRRPRGLSESSVMDKDRLDRRERERSDRPPRTESEERRRRERRREREERHKREKEKVRKGEKSRRPPQGLDIIDKLDVTGIYGQGLFHHDGPFDACNPHRNARKNARAPMQAFPAGSANMALGGGGPVNQRIDLDKFHGRGEEGFEAFAATRKADTAIVDPTSRTEPVHGDETYGLGTSTFLEGAPASRRDMQRRDSEDAVQASVNKDAGGLQRKRSLAQRLRGMSNARQRPGDLRSPETRYGSIGGDGTASPSGNYAANKVMSAGGPSRAKYTAENEVNPFENDYEDAFEKKGAQIRIAEQDKPSRAPAPSSPRGNNLVRSVTADSGLRPPSNDGEKPNGGGFLNRMKSLRGGRRTRPERRGS